MGLPTNIDSTYSDDPDDLTVKLHQQHHDTLHGQHNTFEGTTPATFTEDATTKANAAQAAAIAAAGGGSNLFVYQAKTSAQSGYPGDGFLLWDDATQVDAANLIVAHRTHNDIDIDILLYIHLLQGSFASGAMILIQERNDSDNYQLWEISGTVSATDFGTPTAYWTAPVTLVNSGGDGTTGFANNQDVFVALVTDRAIAAAAIAFTPDGSIAATDVQAAIQEVRDEAGSSGGTVVGLNVLDYGAVGDGTTDDYAAIQACIDAAVNSTFVGLPRDVYVPSGKYLLSDALTADLQGIRIIGEGVAGVESTLGTGTTQFLVANGKWGLICGSAVTQEFRGYGVENIEFHEQNAGQALGGLKLLAASDSIIKGVACGRFTAGTGIKVEGTSSEVQNQYSTFIDCRIGRCLIGYHQEAANGTRWIGGYIDGSNNGVVAPIADSIGIKLESGDTFRSFGTIVQGWDTCVEVGNNLGHEFYGLRCEIWVTQAVHVLAGARRTKLHGYGGNSLNGNLGAGVVIEATAEDTVDAMHMQDCNEGRHIDNGTRTRFPEGDGPAQQASILGTVVGKRPEYNTQGELMGYSPIYDTIIGTFRVKTIGQKQTDASGVTASLTFTVPAGGIAVGQHILLAGGYGQATPRTITVTDNATGGSNTYTTRPQANKGDNNTPNAWVADALVERALDAGDTITVAFSASVNYPIAHAFQYGGIAQTSWLDDSAVATGASTSPASGDVTTTEAGDLLFAALYFAKPNSASTPGAGLAVVASNDNTTKLLDTIEGTALTAGTHSVAATITSADWAISLAAYKAA